MNEATVTRVGWLFVGLTPPLRTDIDDVVSFEERDGFVFSKRTSGDRVVTQIHERRVLPEWRPSHAPQMVGL